MGTLTFRPTSRQLRNLLLFAVALALVAAVILTISRERALGLGLGIGLGSLLSGWCWVAFSRAFTECGPAGIQTCGLGRERRCGWRQVSDIAIRTSHGRAGTMRTVTVIMTSGRRVLTPQVLTWRSGRRRRHARPGVRREGQPDPRLLARRDRSARRLTGREPAAAKPLGRGGRRTTQVRVFPTAAAFLALVVVGGSWLIVTLKSVPPDAPSRTALACADYTVWALAQDGTGPPGTDRAFLARAAREAPAGPLSGDLATLVADVDTATIGNGTVMGVVAEANVLTDMGAADQACA